MWKFVLAVILIASPAWAQEQPTAYEALRVVSQQLNRAMVGRVISVYGTKGIPQPAKWTIQVADCRQPGGVLEIDVANGTVVAQRAPTGITGSTAGAVINTARLNLDSSGAFTVARYTAEKSQVRLDSVTYTLRNNDSGFPVWIVTLLDQARRPVGTIHIGANKGNVTRVEGMFRGANMANVEQDRPPDRRRQQQQQTVDDYSDLDSEYVEEAAGGDENIVKRQIKQMFRRTKREAKEMFSRVRRPFDEYIDRR